MNRRRKLALIGSGNIGGTIALLASMRNCYDIVMFDVFGDMAKGKALDLNQMCALGGWDTSLMGTNSYADIKDADVCIVTAGIPRKPGQSREDLLAINLKAMKEVAQGIKENAPNAFVVVVTNPLDAMVYAFQRVSGLPKNKVIGMAGVLDSARFRMFIAEKMKVSRRDVEAMVLGGHGDDMVPLTKYTTAGGISLSAWMDNDTITKDSVDAIVDRTRKGGGEIVQLLGNGSAFYAPAMSALNMAESYLHDQKRLLPCAVMLNGEYDVKDLFIGVPTVIGASGIEKIVQLELNEDEKRMFSKSVESVKKTCEEVNRLI